MKVKRLTRDRIVIDVTKSLLFFKITKTYFSWYSETDFKFLWYNEKKKEIVLDEKKASKLTKKAIKTIKEEYYV